MATTTTQADELPRQPIPFHLCDDVLDRDFDDLDASELDVELGNERSHAEVPQPDGFGLPTHDCWVYRAARMHNVRSTTIDTLVVAATSPSEVQFEALALCVRLEAQGARVLPMAAPRTRGMGREVDVRFVRRAPEVRGVWRRSVEEVADTGWQRLMDACETRARVEELLAELGGAA